MSDYPEAEAVTIGQAAPAPPAVDQTFVLGTTWALGVALSWPGSSGAVDLTGASFSLEVVNAAGAAVVPPSAAATTIGTPATAGDAMIEVPPSAQTAIAPGAYFYTLLVTLEDASVFLVLRGSWVVLPSAQSLAAAA